MHSLRRRIQSGKTNEQTLPLTTTSVVAAATASPTDASENQYSPGRCCRSPLRFLLTTLAALVAILWLADELLVYLSVPCLPKSSRGVAVLTNPDDARVAVVSLHKGFKYHGPLRRWLSQNKRLYAERHGYSYIDESQYPTDELLPPLDTAW